MPLILPGNVASATADAGYNIANSVRYNPGDSPNMALTFGTPTDNLKWTWSGWIKKCVTLSGDARVISDVYAASPGRGGGPWIMPNDFYRYRNWFGDADKGNLTTNQKLRDTASWYHIVQVYDSANATAGNRMRLYINGVEVTSFSTDTNPDEDQASSFNAALEHHLGSYRGIGDHWDGYLAEIILIDGQALAATSFGEFDEDSPSMWKPKDPSGLTFGDNGFWLDFENSSALGNDVSGNDNDWTPANLDATDQATDTPTNNFCTFNSLAITTTIGDDLTFTQGDCRIANTSDGAWHPAIGTMAVNAGKWYCEFKCTTIGAASSYAVLDTIQYGDQVNFADASRGYSYGYNNGPAINDGNFDDNWGDSFTTGDIISVAMDLTNMKLYLAKNGTWQDSGDPTSGATGTGTHTYFGGGSNTTRAAGTDYYAFAVGVHNSSVTEANFGGCPAFSISSAAADANGYGTFEYAPPSGYLALCTKNLGSDGG